MATGKTGLDYFPLNINFFDNDKTQLISARFGLKGENIMIRLLCKIYSDSYFYRFGKDELLLFTKRIGDGCKCNFVSDVVKELLDRDFFDKEIYDKYKILTSAGIQQRYFEATSRLKTVYVHKQLLLMDTSQQDNVYIYDEDECRITANGDIFMQSKVKKSKVKKSKRETSHLDEELSEETPFMETDYEKFLRWLQKNAPYCADEENFPHQITEEEFRKLKIKYSSKEVAFIIEQLENRKDLRKRYSNLYRTVLNWAKREYEN